MKFITDTWKMLGKPIYVGKRLRSNLNALTVVSIFCTALGLGLFIMNVIIKQYSMLIPCIVTFLGGALCAFFSAVLKKRNIAIIVPTVFCAVVFTYYYLTGAAEGTAVLFSLLLPVGMSYFVSVKYGIFLSVYYTLLFSVFGYTPLRSVVEGYYSEMFLLRLPVIYASSAIFTAIAMIQYHRSVLIENEYTEKLSSEVEKQTKVATERAIKLERLSEEMVLMLANVIDAKDKYTNGHSFRVSGYSVSLAKKLGWSEKEIAELRWEALLHDIGKIGVPDQVLNKPGKLNVDEFGIIKSHTTVGGDILAKSSELLGASDTARYHHERYDGTGYPEGISGKDIPYHARVVSIADAYDAMHSNRVYRPGLPRGTIRSELVKGRGSQFDPEYLDAFLELFDSGELDRIGEN